MTNLKGGKMPVSARPEPTFEAFDDPFGDPLMIPQKSKDSFKENGYEIRFINLKKLKEMGGYHVRGWQVYSKAKFGKLDMSEFHRGSDPDGKIIRGDLILAIRPITLGDKHRKMLKEKRDRLAKAQSKGASELRTIAKGRAEIHEGYEED